MDAKELHRLLKKEQLHCQVLEVDKEVEASRAAKFRKIALDATQPETTRVLHADRSALPRPTLPVVSPILNPIGPTITQSPPKNLLGVRRKRRLSFTNSPTQISKRACLVQNISIASVSTSEPRSPEMLVTTDVNAPVLDVAGILRNQGLKSLGLTSAEATCAEETPGIGWDLFRETFGGIKRSEWPNCSKKSGYEAFLCADAVAQPFTPLDPGKPGLVLRLPAATGSSQNDESTFHVLATMPQGGTLYYRGKYAKIPLPRLQFKWENLPKEFQERWIGRALSGVMRALRARIELRKIQKREPAAAEVEEYSRLHFKDQMTYRQISAAFQSGDEKMIVDGIYCTAYDSRLAKIIQGSVQTNGD